MLQLVEKKSIDELVQLLNTKNKTDYTMQHYKVIFYIQDNEKSV